MQVSSPPSSAGRALIVSFGGTVPANTTRYLRFYDDGVNAGPLYRYMSGNLTVKKVRVIGQTNALAISGTRVQLFNAEFGGIGVGPELELVAGTSLVQTLEADADLQFNATQQYCMRVVCDDLVQQATLHNVQLELEVGE